MVNSLPCRELNSQRTGGVGGLGLGLGGEREREREILGH